MALFEFHRHGVGERELRRLERKIDEMTQQFNDIKAQLDRIDAATTDIAGDIRELLEKVSTSMTPAEVTAVTTGLTAAADALEATAAEVPEEPVPPVTP